MNLPSEYSEIANSGEVINGDAFRAIVNKHVEYREDFFNRNKLDKLEYCSDKDYFPDIREFAFSCNQVYFGWRDGRYCIAMMGKGLCAFQYRCDLITADTKEEADSLMLLECQRQRNEFNEWRESLDK